MERNTPKTKCGPSLKVRESLGETLHRVWPISEGERERVSKRERARESKAALQNMTWLDFMD